MNARDWALVELDRTRLPGWRGNILRDRSSHDPIDSRDRALGEQIRIGVIKNLLRVRHLIEHHSGRRLKDIDELAQKILAIGLYQLRFLDRIPHSAAVDEAVEQAKRHGRARAAGFVNAVLRNALRNPDPPMPNEIAYSHPRELLNRIRNLVGDERAIEFCAHDNAEAPTIVRLAKGAPIEVLADESIQITPHEQAGMFVVRGGKPSLFAEWSRRGLAQPQDPTSADVIEHLDLQPGQRVLDRCAGMGTKTMQMLERIGPTGRIVAIDPAAPRVRALRELLKDRAISNVDVYQNRWMRQLPDVAGERFDRILIDVPCSNSGVLARRPEARYAQDDQPLADLRDVQLQILADTAPHLADGGRLVYSTCSVWPEENHRLLESFCAANLDYKIVESRLTLPSFDGPPERYRDGGFFGILRRNPPRRPELIF